jgi:hypothetical protein
MQKILSLIFIFLVFFVLLPGCNQPPVETPSIIVSTPVYTPSPFVENSTAEVHSQTPTIAPTFVSSPTPTQEIKLCPSVNTDIEFPVLEGSEIIETTILKYLNAGGDPEKIISTMSLLEEPPFFLLTSDLNGDKLSEVVLSTKDKAKDEDTISILQCTHAGYEIVKNFVLDDVYSADYMYSDQIFRDGPPLLIWYRNSIYPFDTYNAIGWHDSNWEMIELGGGISPSIILFDQNIDGIKEVFIRSGFTPYDQFNEVDIDVFSWNGFIFGYDGNEHFPGNSRIEYIFLADRKWIEGNPSLAITYYEAAAYSKTLIGFPSYNEISTHQTHLSDSYQQSFAYFRLIASWIYLNRPEMAGSYLQDMQDDFPSGKPGNEFTLAANELIISYEKTSSYQESCSEAVKFLDRQYPDIITNHLVFPRLGSSYIETSDICFIR